MRKTVLILATLVLTLGGTAAVLAHAGPSDEGSVESQQLEGPIVEVLDELVAEGTLTADQSEAIVAALREKLTEVRAERRATRELLAELWADGELSREEIAQLPSWHPWTRVIAALDDGVITRDELRDLGRRRHLRWR